MDSDLHFSLCSGIPLNNINQLSCLFECSLTIDLFSDMSVTEKVYEEVSTDASSSEEGKENEDNAGSLIKNTLFKNEKQSPSKRTKQSTLLSFFKK